MILFRELGVPAIICYFFRFLLTLKKPLIFKFRPSFGAPVRSLRKWWKESNYGALRGET